jgi:hypothetical protein
VHLRQKNDGPEFSPIPGKVRDLEILEAELAFDALERRRGREAAFVTSQGRGRDDHPGDDHAVFL